MIISPRQLGFDMRRAQQGRRLVLDHDLGFEIKPGVQAEIFVRRARVAIGAAVLATTVGVDAVAEADIGTVVRGQNRLRIVRQKLGRHRATRSQQLVIRRELIDIRFPPQRLEPVRRAGRRPAPHHSCSLVVRHDENRVASRGEERDAQPALVDERTLREIIPWTIVAGSLPPSRATTQVAKSRNDAQKCRALRDRIALLLYGKCKGHEKIRYSDRDVGHQKTQKAADRDMRECSSIA